MLEHHRLLQNYILVGKKAVREPNLMKWAKWFETGNRKVAETFYKGKRISTVFLGINHSFNLNSASKPLLFETMVFPESDICERYSTWEEAEIGHKKIVAKLMGMKK